jgi:hypothetical protein
MLTRNSSLRFGMCSVLLLSISCSDSDSRPNRGEGVAPSATGRTESGTDYEARIKRAAGDSYASIEGFGKAMATMNEVQGMMKTLTTSDSRADPQGVLDRYKAKVARMLLEGGKCDGRRMNAVYQGWGDHFHADFMPGARTLLRGLELPDKKVIAEGDAHFARWNVWYRDNHSSLFLRLRDKFGFEVK